MIPLSFILFFEKNKINFFTIITISLALGLSRSDLLRIYVFLGLVLYIIICLYKKSFQIRKVLPLILILLFPKVLNNFPLTPFLLFMLSPTMAMFDKELSI